MPETQRQKGVCKITRVLEAELWIQTLTRPLASFYPCTSEKQDYPKNQTRPTSTTLMCQLLQIESCRLKLPVKLGHFCDFLIYHNKMHFISIAEQLVSGMPFSLQRKQSIRF